MTASDSLNLLRGYLDSQQYGVKGSGGRETQPFVTLSRETGAGGISVGSRLRDILQAEDTHARSAWLRFDRDLLKRVIEEHNLPKEVANLMDQSQYHRVLKWIDELMGQYVSWSTLARKTGQTILHLAQIGNVIVVGSGANMLTRDLPGGLHARVIGSLPRRISHACEYYKLTRNEAQRFIAREDSSRAMYVKDHFGVDIADPQYYDLTINTDTVGYEGAAVLIAAEVRRIRERLAGEPVGRGARA